MYVYMHARIHTHTYIHTCMIYMCVCTHACAHTHSFLEHVLTICIWRLERERNNVLRILIEKLVGYMHVCCICVWRERERQRERDVFSMYTWVIKKDLKICDIKE